jgi:ATP-dependent Zn protease
LDTATFPDEVKSQFLNKALAIKNQCMDEITKFMQEHKAQLKLIAQALLEKQSLTGQEVANIAGIAY